jgi:hypothetical protein
VAFKSIEPSRHGSAMRAEALGIRYVLAQNDGAPPSGWRRLEQAEHLQLWTHDGPTSLIGVGCVRETWRGSDTELRNRVQEQLRTSEGADKLLSPHALVALLHGDSEFEVHREPSEDCDPSSASVIPAPREPGALEAVVTSRSPVDVVLRVSAFPTWRVEINGRPAAPLRVVAPGFLAIRVPAGTHHIEATAHWTPFYFWGLIAGALGAIAAAILRWEHARRAAQWIRRPRPAQDAHRGKIS